MKKRKAVKVIIIVICSILILSTILLIAFFPYSKGEIKPFLDENGEILTGSISEKILIDINNTSLGMFIVGKDVSKPVLLFLGGGPGIPEYLLETIAPTGLEEHFVVCYLEYRGTSLSYDPKMPIETMNTKQHIDDVVATTSYLQNRFGQDEIYIMGHSYGSYIGLLTVQENPELYLAYIAIGQITNQKQSEELAYSYMLENYHDSESYDKIKQFESYPILESDDAYQEYYTSALRDNSMHELGIGTMHNMTSVISGIFFPSLRCSVYTQKERIDIWHGKSFAENTDVTEESRYFNAFEEVPQIEIPIYFLAGVHDYTCNYSLQKEYFEHIKSPLKGFYTFENSSHSPLFEEPLVAINILSEDVLLGENNLSDLVK